MTKGRWRHTTEARSQIIGLLVLLVLLAVRGIPTLGTEPLGGPCFRWGPPDRHYSIARSSQQSCTSQVVATLVCNLLPSRDCASTKMVAAEHDVAPTRKHRGHAIGLSTRPKRSLPCQRLANSWFDPLFGDRRRRV